MKIITLAIPESNIGFQCLRASAHNAGLDVINIAKPGDTWQGFETKMHLYLRACEQYKDEDLLCIVDAFDVLVHPSAKRRLESLALWFGQHPETSLLTGREVHCSDRNCLMIRPFLHTMPEDRKHKDRLYVNSGVIAGRPAALAGLWRFMLVTGMYDDQQGLSMFMNLRKFPYVDIDEHSNRLVTNVVNYAVLKWYSTEEIHSPFVHLPGFSSSGLSLAYRSLATQWAGMPGFPVSQKSKLVIALVVLLLIAVVQIAYDSGHLHSLALIGATSLFWAKWIHVTKSSVL